MFKKIKKLKVKKVKKGFTLMEVIIAVSVFVIVVSAVSGVFAKMVKNYHYVKVTQKDLENAQYAMNLIAKTLRTSSVVDNSSSNSIRIYDYSQQKCIEYKFSGNNLLYSSAGIDKDSCPSDTLTKNPNLIESSVSSGIFEAVASSNEGGNEKVGKVIISMDVSSGSNPIHIQTSVSLRDYSEIMQ